MALGYTDADRKARLAALVHGAQALEQRWQPIRAFLANVQPASVLEALDRLRSESDFELAVERGLVELTAMRRDGRALGLPLPSVPKAQRAYVSGDMMIAGSTYDDLRARAELMAASWLPMRTFLERQAFPTIEMIRNLAFNDLHDQKDALGSLMSSKLSALVKKGVALGLPPPSIATPIPQTTLTVRGDSAMTDDINAAHSFEGFGRNAQSSGLAELARVIDPVGRGARVSFDLSPDAMLTVEICVDGRCYRAQSDVGDLLAGVNDWATSYHHQLHDLSDPNSAANLPAPVQSAGVMLVGALLDEHVGVVCGGFWSSLKHGISDAAKSVKRTVKKMKGPISVAAGIAAGAAASALPGGVVIAPMAAKFANSMVNAAAGEGSVKAAAETALAEAKIAATVDPDVKKALAKAQTAVAKTAAAYHVADVAEAAGLGDTTAMKQLRDLDAAAKKGDPAAQKVMEIAQGVTLAEAANANAANGTVSAVSGVLIGRTSTPLSDASKARARTYAINRVAKGRRTPFGYVHLMTGQRFVHTFKTLDDADDWFGRLEPGSYIYAAYFDPQGEMFPLPENDAEFHPTINSNASSERFTRGPATVSGMPAPGRRDPIFVDVPTVDEDGNYTGLAVKWPTSQNAAHGGVPDGYADLPHKGTRAYFWLPPGIVSPLDITDEMKPFVRWWQPPWRPTPHRMREPSVAIEAVETVPAGPSVTIESVRPISRAQAAHEVAHAVTVQGIPAWGPFMLAAAMGAGTIAAYEWYERRQSAKRAAQVAPSSASAVPVTSAGVAWLPLLAAAGFIAPPLFLSAMGGM